MRSLSRLTTRQMAEAGAADVVAVPVGSTEQHGPHLPLTTDVDIAGWLVGALTQARPEVIAAPPLAYGAAGEHEGFPGTMSIGQEALQHVLVELGRSATRTVERVLFVSSHGGNAAPLARAVALLRTEGRDVRAWSPTWGGDAHAGRTETSLMLHIDPRRVVLDQAEAGNTRPLPELLPQLRRAGVAAVAPNGVLGDPAGATAREGSALVARAVAELCQLLAGWAGGGGREAVPPRPARQSTGGAGR